MISSEQWRDSTTHLHAPIHPHCRLQGRRKARGQDKKSASQNSVLPVASLWKQRSTDSPWTNKQMNQWMSVLVTEEEWEASLDSVLSHVQLFLMLQTVAHQAPLTLGFPRQEYSSGLPFPPPWVFLTQGSNPHLLCLLQSRQVLYLLSHQGSPRLDHICHKTGKPTEWTKTITMFYW